LGPQSPSIFAGGADQLVALLPPGTALRVNTHAAQKGRPRATIAIRIVGARPTHDSAVAIRGQRDRYAWLVLPTAPVPTSFGRCWKTAAAQLALEQPPLAARRQLRRLRRAFGSRKNRLARQIPLGKSR